MNATLRAQGAYAEAATPIRTSRSLEYDTIARVTHQLQAATVNKETDYTSFVKALDTNRKLWRILATDVSSPGNKLPVELKSRIFYLAEFTFHETRKILKRNGSVAELVNLNLEILRGLNPRSI